MATHPDIIVIDEEKYPHIATVGTKMGENLSLEYYSLDDVHFQYIPPHIHYLRFDYNTANFGMKYWGEVRNMKSEYGVDDDGTTLKDKVEIDSTLGAKYVNPFMTGVITLKIQEIFEERYSTLYDSWGFLERETWVDQLCEATAYIADNSFETKLIHRLAEVRGLTTADFAAIVIEKQDAWKTKVYDLAVQEQTLITKLKSSANVMEVVVFLEDYFGESMTSEQCLDYGRCTQDDTTGLISRKSEVKYGIQF